MKARIIAGVAAATLSLCMGVASAAEVGGSRIMDGASPDYLQQQQQLLNEPGYSIGTGAAYVGDGSASTYGATRRVVRIMSGFQLGDAIARVNFGP